MSKITKLFFIGCGAVGFCLLELFKLEDIYSDCEFIIIEPKRQIPNLTDIMTGRKYIHIAQALTPSNIQHLLYGVDNASLIVNVSVNVDSILLLRVAKERGAYYIDTSLEMYENHIKVPVPKIKRYSQFKENNLYHQNLLAEKLLEHTTKTRIVSCGMNPGFISELTKKALLEYAKTKGHSLEKGNYAKLAHELGLTEIQVVECDTQNVKVKATPSKFVNTWSSIGFQEEASDLVMLSLNNADIADLSRAGYKLIKPTEGTKDTHIRFIPEYGMDMTRESITLDPSGTPFKYTGHVITHAEVITLSEFLTYDGDAPSVMYVYRPCSQAEKSLDYFRKNKYHILKNEVVVRSKDITSGFDSIGALLTFKNGDRFGGWTIISIEDTAKLGLLSNPTTLQVAGSMIGAIHWMLKNPKEGLAQAEDINHKFIFENYSKYFGKLFFKKI